MSTSERLVNIAYLGGSHGAFLKYFIDRFSKLTPIILEEPFMHNGTSHNPSVNYSNKVYRYTFENIDGEPKNNYEFENKNEPHILILIDDESIFNHTRLIFLREDDHEFKGTSFTELSNSILLSKKFVQMYHKKIKEIYNYDISTSTCPKIILRDFLKLIFLNPNSNKSLISSKKTLKNINNKTVCIKLSEIWNTEKFFKKMKEVNNQLKLDLDLGQDAISFHKTFLSKISIHKTFNRVFDVIEHIKQKNNYDCTKLDLVEQAYLSVWLEKNNSFIQVPNTREFFKDTLEIVEYIEFYPNHYKAMNPNLPIFNGIPNPFHLWNLKK